MGNLMSINGLRQSWTKHRQLQKPWQEHTYIAIDIETTGLDPINDQICQCLGSNKAADDLNCEAQYHEFCVHPDVDLQQSPTIHGLTKAQLSSGGDVKKVLKDLEDKLYGCVMVCHHRSLDWSYLRDNRLTENLHFEPLGVFDTLSFEKNKMSFDNEFQLHNSSLTLAACRKRHGLPIYTSHHAMDDAIACAGIIFGAGYTKSSLTTRNYASC